MRGNDVVILPPPIQNLMASLKPYDTWVVGGFVRDHFLKRPTKDADIAIRGPLTGWRPLITHLKPHIFQRYESASMTYDPFKYHIARLRRDIHTFGRQADIAPTDILAEDAQRRDFTINAVYVDSTGQIIDFFGGVNDMQNGVVRFIGDPATRIHEDVLRILRFFRFASFFQNPVDASILPCIQANMAHLQTLSRERFSEEYLRILKEPYCLPVLTCMNDIGLHHLMFGQDLTLPEVWNLRDIIVLNGLAQRLIIPRRLLKTSS